MLGLKEEMEKILEVLYSVQGFEDFCKENYPFPAGYDMISNFKKWKSYHGNITREEDLILSIVSERFEALQKQINSNSLSGYSRPLCVKDKTLNNFLQDWERCKTKEVDFKRTEIQHYRTIREYIAYYGVDVSPIYDKYKNSVNPYINACFALAFDGAGMFDIGLFHLEKAITYAIANPNPYWNTPLAIYGCTDAIAEILNLIGNNDKLSDLFLSDVHLKMKAMELLYLYMSRSIHIIENSPQSADWLSNRADILYNNGSIFTMIFTDNLFPAINIDIQFMSDKAYSYSIAEANEIGVVFRQEWKDAYKMYQNDSLVPNSTGGLRDMEDATFDELNKRGMIRSIELANKLYKKYIDGEYCLDHEKIHNVFYHLKQTYQNRPTNFKWSKM